MVAPHNDVRLPLLITGIAGVAGYNALHYFQAKYPGQVIGVRQRNNWRTAALVIPPVVRAVYQRKNSPSGLAIAVGDEGLASSVVVEGVVSVADKLFLVLPKRRNPVGVGRMKPPREVEKIPFVAAGDARLDDDSGHGADRSTATRITAKIAATP